MVMFNAVTPNAGTASGNARVMRRRAIPTESLDGPVEPVADRAPDHGSFERPIGRVHPEPAHDLGRQATACAAIPVKVGGQLKNIIVASVGHVRCGDGRRSAMPTTALPAAGECAQCRLKQDCGLSVENGDAC